MLDKDLYKKRIRETYHAIYDDRYNFHPTIMEYERKKISKNIQEMQLEISDLKKMNVFNIGTGLESIIFHTLGAKKIYHYDISEIQVKNLNQLKKADPKFHNLYSQQINVVEDKLSIPDGIDLIYLQGVVHHFSDPKKGLDNIFPNINKDAKIFIRNYRSGTLQFFTAEMIRRFITHDCLSCLADVFKERFGNVPLNHGEWIYNLYTHLYASCVDHGFVPALHLLDPEKFNNYFENNGFESINFKKMPDYDHDNSKDIGSTQINYIYTKKTDRTDKISGEFPTHIDQLDDISYKEKYITKTVETMNRKLPKIKTLSSREKTKLMIELFFIADSYRFIKFYLNGKHNIDKEKFKLLSTVPEIHGQLQKELEKL